MSGATTTTSTSSLLLTGCDEGFYAVPLVGTIIIAVLSFVMGITMALAIVFCCCRRPNLPKDVVALKLSATKQQQHHHNNHYEQADSNSDPSTAGQQQQRYNTEDFTIFQAGQQQQRNKHSQPIKIVKSSVTAGSEPRSIVNGAASFDLPPQSNNNTNDIERRNLGSLEAEESGGRGEDVRQQLRDYTSANEETFEKDVDEFMTNPSGPETSRNTLSHYKPTKTIVRTSAVEGISNENDLEV